MKVLLLSFIIGLIFLPQIVFSSNCKSRFEIPFETENGRAYVQVLVNGKPYRFLFDTGAWGFGRIDSSLVKQLKLPVTGTSENFDGVNTSDINNVKVKNLHLAGLKAENVIMLSRSYNRPGQKSRFVYGIIGREFWKNYLLTIDNKRKRLIFSDTSLSETDKNTVSYKEPFIIPFQIGNTQLHGNVDTGSSLVMHLPFGYTKRFKVFDLLKDGEGRRANTTFTLWKGTFVDEIIIAGNIEKNLEVRFSELAEDINIGMGLLQNYNISIDQKNRLIKLQRFD